MTIEKNEVCQAMVDGAIASFRSNKGWADKAIAQVSDDKLHVARDPQYEQHRRHHEACNRQPAFSLD